MGCTPKASAWFSIALGPRYSINPSQVIWGILPDLGARRLGKRCRNDLLDLRLRRKHSGSAWASDQDVGDSISAIGASIIPSLPGGVT